MTAPFNPLAALAFCWRKIGAQAASIALVFSMLSGMSTQAYAQANGAQFVAQSVPAVMVAGQSYSVSVTMKNTGTKSWTAAAMYRLGAVNPQNSRTWLQDARAHINPATTVAPGAQYTFAFNVSAPSAAGTYNFQWQMLLEFVEWFGATTPNVAVVVNPPKPNQAKFISQSVPGAMTAGNSYDVSVTFKNTGTVTWTSATDFKLGAQNPQDNEVWIKRVNLPGSVAPGQDAIFRFTVRAPATNGSYDFQWRMLREFVEWFGDYSPNAPVTVSGGTQPATTFFHNDVAGTPMMATGTDGKVVWTENYRPYGEQLNQQLASSTNHLWFAGKPYDQNTGLSYMGARYYSSLLGRFFSMDPATVDPANLHSFNRYAYANNNPYRFVDPDGHSPLDVAFLVYDLGKLGVAAYTGVGVGAALVDVGLSVVGVASPMFGVGEAFKALRATEHAVVAVNDAHQGIAAAKGATPLIKAGAAGGETAGKVFPQAVKDAAKAENPLSTCVYCRMEGTGTQVDHAIPRVRGGDATLENAHMACPHCNASKGARDFPVNPPPGYRGEWPPGHW